MALGTLNVLHVVLSFRAGGRRNAIADLAARSKREVNTHLCCVDELGCERAELNGTFESVSVLERNSNRTWRARRALIALCRQHDIHLIHAHDAASQFMGALLKLRLPRTHLLMTFHRTLGFESERFRDKVRNAWCGWLSAAVVTASAERKAHFLSENAVSEGKLAVIPLGVDLVRMRPDMQARQEVRATLGLDERTTIVGAIGHFGPEKGIDQAIEAFNAFSNGNPNSNAALVILGNGSDEDRQRLLKLSRQNRCRPAIFAGFRSDVPRWLSAFDILLHTPRLEAFGLVVVEAMACGLPVIATSAGSMPEIVRNGKSGLLVEAGSIAAIADSLKRLIEDPQLRRQLGSCGQQIAREEYSSELCARRYVDLYHRVCRRERIS